MAFAAEDDESVGIPPESIDGACARVSFASLGMQAIGRVGGKDGQWGIVAGELGGIGVLEPGDVALIRGAPDAFNRPGLFKRRECIQVLIFGLFRPLRLMFVAGIGAPYRRLRRARLPGRGRRLNQPVRNATVLERVAFVAGPKSAIIQVAPRGL